MVEQLAYSYLLEIAPPDTEPPPIGQNWHQRFFKRHPNLKTKWVRSIAQQRAFANNPATIRAWFSLYIKTKEHYNISDNCVYNMDEKGFAMGVAKGAKYVCHRAIHETFVTAPGNKEWVSVIACIGMSGQWLSPYIIFKGKTQMVGWWESIVKSSYLPATTVGVSANGWSDSYHGLKWLQRVFDVETKDIAKQDLESGGSGYRLLLVDGHDSHKTTDSIQYCFKHHIIVLVLPPHATHLLQPLDVGIFSTMTGAYSQGVDKASRLGVQFISKAKFLEIYASILEDVFKLNTIVNAFRACGLGGLGEEVDQQRVLDKLPNRQRPVTPPPAAVDDDVTPSSPITPSTECDFQKLQRAAKTQTTSPRKLLKYLDKIVGEGQAAAAMSQYLKQQNKTLMDDKVARKEQNNTARKRLNSARVLTLDEAEKKLSLAIERETKKAKTMANQAAKQQARIQQEVVNQNTKRDNLVAKAKELSQRRATEQEELELEGQEELGQEELDELEHELRQREVLQEVDIQQLWQNIQQGIQQTQEQQVVDLEPINRPPARFVNMFQSSFH